MKRLFGLTMLAIATAPAAGLTQVQTYYHAGAWDAFSGRDEKGGALCGVGNTSPDGERRLSMRFNIGGTATNFMVSKPDWTIPDGSRIAVVMQVGLNTPWTEQAVGHVHGMDWTLDQSAMQVFDRQFRGASSMTLTFPDGNEPPWTIPLDGSSAISGTFGRCITDLTRQVQTAQPPAAGDAAPAAGPTQPFSPAAPAK